MPAKSDGDDFILSGRKRSVPYASEATRLIVLARTDAGVDLFLVDPNADGVSMKQAPRARARAAVPDRLRQRARFGDGSKSARPDPAGRPGTRSCSTGSSCSRVRRSGGANRCLEETVAYANQRIQFDKPLGAFQALAHYMADASTNIDGGRVLVHEAAWNRSVGRSIARFAPMAKLFCCETYRETTRVCAQIWGGVAFTIEYDQQMFFRRAKALQLTWWDTPYLEELIAADVLDD